MAINIGVDVGGTFTDFAVSGPASGTLYYKLPSTPEKPDQAIIAGLEDLLRNNALEPNGILRFRMARQWVQTLLFNGGWVRSRS